jgi:hypothetical protein
MELTTTNRPAGLALSCFFVDFGWRTGKSQCVSPVHKTKVAGDERDSTINREHLGTISSVSGGYSGDVTPDPISNSEVKLASANGTARETVWESRTPPDLSWEPRP